MPADTRPPGGAERQPAPGDWIGPLNQAPPDPAPDTPDQGDCGAPR